MNLNLKRKRFANRISIGDSHDLSIEWFMTHTDYPFYVIECVGERFNICGAEEVKEKKSGKAETKAGPPDEKKADKKPTTKRNSKPKIGGTRGRRK